MTESCCNRSDPGRLYPDIDRWVLYPRGNYSSQQEPDRKCVLGAPGRHSLCVDYRHSPSPPGGYDVQLQAGQEVPPFWTGSEPRVLMVHVVCVWPRSALYRHLVATLCICKPTGSASILDQVLMGDVVCIGPRPITRAIQWQKMQLQP